MGHIELQIQTAGDRQLGARLYEPASTPRGQVVIHGATATQQRYYGAFARHLAWRGFRVLTYDYRGVGRSKTVPIAEDPTTMSDWIDDAAAAQRWLVEQGPHLPLLCVGHSFGGQAATVLSNAGRPDAIVTVGAGSGFWRGSPTGLAARRWLAWTVALPTMCRTFGYLPGWAGLGEDLPAGVARQWAKWCRAEGYFLGEYPQWRAMMAAYDGPVLALSFTDDDYAPVPNVRWLLGRLTNADVEHRHLRPGQVDLPRVGHFGFFRASAAGPLWSHAVLALQHATRQASLGRVRPASRALRDVMADLQYGQA